MTWWRGLKIFAVVVVVGFLAWSVARDLSKVDDWSRIRPDARWVAMSALMTFCAGLCVLVSYRWLLFAYGARPTWREMMPVAWVPTVGKYIPGRVVAIAGAVVMLRKIGVGGAVAMGVVLTLDLFSVLAGLVIASPLLMRPPLSDRFPGGFYVAIAAILGGIVLLHPKVSGTLINFTLRRLKKPKLEKLPTTRQYVPSLVCAFLQWGFAGLSTWAMLNALSPVSLWSWPVLCSITACAMTLGYLSIIAPAGIGVRDVLFLILLKQILPGLPDYQIAAAVVFLRLQQTLIDVTLAGVGVVIMRKFGKTDFESAP